MAFQVNRFDGTLLTSLADGTIDSTASSIRLLGKGVVNYGEIVAEDFVHVLENFASATPPPNPIDGQAWWDRTEQILKVYNGTEFVTAGGVTSGSTVEVGIAGDACTDPAGTLFWNTDTSQLFVCDGSQLILIGPGGSIGDSTGSIFIEDSGNPLMLIIIDGVVVAAWSKADFNPTFVGNVQVGADTVPVDLTVSFPGAQGGLDVGLNLAVNVAGNKFVGTATSGEYSDLAERYAVDTSVEPGDVVKLGGEVEITKTSVYADSDVFGVVSTNPGLMMNSTAGTNETHPFIALAGRVPCKVVGRITKGQRLVSSNVPGVAQTLGTTTPDMIWAVIGRALEDKNTDDVGLVEIAVGVK